MKQQDGAGKLTDFNTIHEPTFWLEIVNTNLKRKEMSKSQSSVENDFSRSRECN